MLPDLLSLSDPFGGSVEESAKGVSAPSRRVSIYFHFVSFPELLDLHEVYYSFYVLLINGEKVIYLPLALIILDKNVSALLPVEGT